MGMKLPGKGAKFKNVRTVVDGRTFASKKEARRYGELVLLQRAGRITGLLTQVRYTFEFRGVKLCDYYSDFDYHEDGVHVVEDVKSPFTRKNPVYRLKRKMMLAFYKVDIREV